MGLARRTSATAVLLALAVSGCTTTSPGGSSTSSSRAQTAAVCPQEPLATVVEGRLTIATYDPVYAPWFIGNDPSNGQGFESALGFRIAQQMGFKPSDVRWVRLPFERIVRPTVGSYDLALAEVSITPERRRYLDFTRGYASTAQAVLTYAGSPLAGKRSLNQLRSARLGGSTQTTSLASIARTIKPTTPPTTFPSIAAAGAALDARRVDGVVADLPTAAYLANSVLDDGVLLGQLAGTEASAAAVLPKGSGLTACSDQALANLTQDGTLGQLQQQWLPRRENIPTLK